MECGSGGAQTGFVGNDEVFEVDVGVMRSRVRAGVRSRAAEFFGQISAFLESFGR